MIFVFLWGTSPSMTTSRFIHAAENNIIYLFCVAEWPLARNNEISFLSEKI